MRNACRAQRRRRFLALPLAVLAFALPVLAAPPEPASLAGEWRGSFRFYETKLAEAHGKLPVRLVFAPDGTLAGEIGDARFSSGKPRATKGHVEYGVKLEGAPRPGIGKDHAIVIVTKAEGGRLSGDLHLKSRLGFDATMHPGDLEATRAK